jgi:subfamily B ATP-binding cassette protein MsbA
VRTAAFFWRFTRPYTGWLALAALTIPLYGAASVALVGLTEPLFRDVLLAPHEAPVPPGGAIRSSPSSANPLNVKAATDRGYQALKAALHIDDRSVVYFVPLLMLVLFFVRGLADFVSGYAFQHVGLGATTGMRNELYRALLTQNVRFHARHSSGALVSRIVSDVAQVQVAASTRLFDFIQQSVLLVMLIALLISTNAKLALLCLACAPLAVVPIARFGRGMRQASERGQTEMATLAALVTEGLRGHRIVKAYAMEAFEVRRFEAASRRHLDANLRAQLLANLSGPVVELLIAGGAAAFLVYAGLKIRSGELTAAGLVQFMTNLLIMYDPIRRLNKVNLAIQQALASAGRVIDMLAVPDDVAERPGATRLERFADRITWDHVVFGYRETPVLKDVTLDIPRGETVALVGPSGAGKTTLANLLPRFFDPDSGRVMIDGHDLRDVTIASLRQLIGIVTQETVLFDDTIRNNIAYGRADIPLERVQAAAVAAYADEFVRQQPAGYDTVIGESGLQLSGGERQRLAIARALLKDAPILILDEAMSQLDSESEVLVQQALRNLKRGRTTLVIAHRLATVVEADRIVVVDDGRIVETGRHQDLLAASGTYRRLFEGQFVGSQPVAT